MLCCACVCFVPVAYYAIQLLQGEGEVLKLIFHFYGLK